jgi:hypothetical protein
MPQVQKFQIKKPCHANEFWPLWTKNPAQMQQSEKKIHQEAIVQYWGHPASQQRQCSYPLGPSKISERQTRSERKSLGSLGKEIHWRRLYPIELI